MKRGGKGSSPIGSGTNNLPRRVLTGREIPIQKSRPEKKGKKLSTKGMFLGGEL